MTDFVVTNPNSSPQITVTGGAGSDRLILTYTVNGGVGNSLGGTLAAGYSGTFLGPAGGEDDVAFSGIENFTFNHATGTGSDGITTGDGDDVISTGADNDLIFSGGGIDQVDGGSGVDRWGADLSAFSQAIIIDLNGSSAYLTTGSVVNVEGFNSLVSGSGNDRLTATALSGSTVNGGAGNDVISLRGDAGNNQVEGGTGSDRLTLTYVTAGGVGNSFAGNLVDGYNGTFFGAGGGEDDSSFAGIENFTITTDVGNDGITTGDGNDVLKSGGGNDTMASGAGIDQIDGGSGVDRWGANLSAFSRAITIDLNGNSTFLTTGSVVNVEGFNSLISGSGNDQLTATALSGSTVNGGAGNDRIKLRGDAGNNQVEGGTGSDRLTLTYVTAGGVGNSFAGNLVDGYNGTFFGAGGGEDDSSFAGIENFTITTDVGNDGITTGDGNDVLKSGGGNDTMASGGGIDQVNGGGGTDRWGANMGTAVADIVINLNTSSSFLGTGLVVNVEGFGGLTTGSGNDQLTATALSGSTVNGGAGNDTITLRGDAGTNSIEGGADNDRLALTYVINGNVSNSFAGNLAAGYNGTFFGPGGGEDDSSFAGIENFSYDHTSGTGSDNITTGDGNDSISTGADNDIMFTGGGIDQIDGGSGVDRWGADLSAFSQNITIDLNGSSTFLTTGSVVNAEGFNSLTTGSGNDQLTATALSGSTVNGGAGNDTITLRGDAGSNQVDGGADNDRLVLTYVTAGNVGNSFAGSLAAGYNGTFFGPGGGEDDSSFAGIENFTIATGSGNDNITAGDGNDMLSGGGGNDTLTGAGGIDTVDGGIGVDRWTANLATATQAINIDLGSASTFLATGSVVNVEGFNIATGSGADRLTGTGLSGSTVSAGAGNDIITLRGDGGNNQVAGEAGNDLFVLTYVTAGPVSNNFAGSLATGYNGTFFGSGGGEDDTGFSGIEKFSVTTGGGNDNITLGDGNDILVGGLGNDTLNAAGGNNEVNGGGASDSLVSGGGKDTLTGGGGNDTMTGGGNVDKLEGSGGDDSFAFNSAGEGRDIVRDFLSADDSFRISAAGFGGGLTAGGSLVNDTTFIANANPTATTTSGTFLYDTDSGVLSWDADGTDAGVATEVAILTNLASVSANDFVIV